MIVYDHRENASGIPNLIGLFDDSISLEEKSLVLGDFLIAERILIERKTALDAVASIKDGRLFEQVFRMLDSEYQPILILEGKRIGMTEESWDGMIATLSRKGISLIKSKDESQTARWLIALHNQELRSSSRELPAVKLQVKATASDEKLVVAMLTAIPGVSVKISRQLLQEFKTLDQLIAADPDDLSKLPGIGKTKSETISRILKHKYNPVELEF
jgi:ERCC4-type nuclease